MPLRPLGGRRGAWGVDGSRQSREEGGGRETERHGARETVGGGGHPHLAGAEQALLALILLQALLLQPRNLCHTSPQRPPPHRPPASARTRQCGGQVARCRWLRVAP